MKRSTVLFVLACAVVVAAACKKKDDEAEAAAILGVAAVTDGDRGAGLCAWCAEDKRI